MRSVTGAGGHPGVNGSGPQTEARTIGGDRPVVHSPPRPGNNLQSPVPVARPFARVVESIWLA